MNGYYEFDMIMEEMMEYGLGAGLLSNGFSSLLSIAGYVLTAIALYTLAKRRGIKKAWLSWVPVFNCWILGSLSDQFRYVAKGEVKNKRKVLLTLNILSGIIGLGVIILAVVVLVFVTTAMIGGDLEEAIVEAILAPGMVMVVLCLPLIGISIATAVVHFMALYDVYTSCTPQNNVVFLVLSILFGITEPFFLFFTRNKDEGMPPRKQAPVYEAPQENWNNPEYL